MRQDIIYATIPSMSEITNVIVVGHLLTLPLMTIVLAALSMDLFRGRIR
ncbi:hypothetical protein [Phytohabitans houttuyneae]|uniref:Uncharacterized protein n=1 Tax=Phytohabitans houttuyneae TaxID=1076126 RepID=A0A6V8K4W8_9ACTN|nr:hypothetical protein [Phytohabitans houttuyneae]GFJ76807.1 hypothetical protein Phou_009870 [Phytohabitans houttuyneae]